MPSLRDFVRQTPSTRHCLGTRPNAAIAIKLHYIKSLIWIGLARKPQATGFAIHFLKVDEHASHQADRDFTAVERCLASTPFVASCPGKVGRNSSVTEIRPPAKSGQERDDS
jgi:hypothetical protein